MICAPVGLAARPDEEKTAVSALRTTEIAVPPNDLLDDATKNQENGSSSPGESQLPTAAPSLCTSYLYLRLSFGDPVDQAVVSMLDLLPEEDLFKLLSGKAYVRQRPGKFLPEETSILHQNAGRLEEQRRKKEAVPSMIVTAEEYEAYGITFMAEFPTGPLDWADNPNKITLVDSMPQIGSSFKNALDTSAIAPAELETVRLAVEQEVAALYQGNAESEVERASKLYGRSGLYLIREMACKLK